LVLDWHHEQANTLVQIFLANDDVALADFARVALLLFKDEVILEFQLGRAAEGAFAPQDVYQGVGDVISHPIVAIIAEVQSVIPVLFTIRFRKRVKGDVSVEVKGVATNCQLGSVLDVADSREVGIDPGDVSCRCKDVP
jgi:hypothetical protein